MDDPLSFEECVQQCVANVEFVREFDRLHGTNVAGRGSPLEYEIDLVSGRIDDDLHKFVVFVHRYVWSRLPPETREPER